ncbi:ABC transporter substrate-binding protein [Flavobacteriaceae bacterium]|nr:ABC transporter substrate-binding protein [Flavobacteriaceae bacterium]
MNLFKYIPILILLFMTSCTNGDTYEEINIGCVLPFYNSANSFGIETKNALLLAVSEYNEQRQGNEPKVNLVFKNGKWSRIQKEVNEQYFDLKKNHNTDIIFLISNSGTFFLNDIFNKSDSETIVVNPLYNYTENDNLHRNIFSISPLVDETNDVISNYIKKEGLKNIEIYQIDNHTWITSSLSVKSLLAEEGIASSIETISRDYDKNSYLLDRILNSKSDAFVFFGNSNAYKLIKELRKQGFKKPIFFGNNLYRHRSKDTHKYVDLGNTMFTYFSPTDGNLKLAEDFLMKYKTKYKEDSKLQWVTMQSYDAMNIILSKLKIVNNNEVKKASFISWLRGELYAVNNYKGVSGDITITESGGAKGIKYSLYTIDSLGGLQKKALK